jgi:hypothetical protein
MLTYGLMLLHENARPHTAALPRALLEYLNWELFDRPPYSPHSTPSDSHLFTWLQSQRFNNDAWCQNVGELTGGRQTYLTQAHKHLFPDTSVSVPAVTMLRSSLSVYVFFYIIFLFSLIAFLLTAHWSLLSE